MNLFRKITVFFIIIVLVIACVPEASIKASEKGFHDRNIVWFEDGSYCISDIVVENAVTINGNRHVVRSATKTRTATKYNKYYNADDELQFIVGVTARFKYDGQSAVAQNSSYGYDVIDARWTFLAGESYCDGASASANCSFGAPSETKRISVTIVCSPDGRIN